jgi:hypothetical protein
MFIHKLPSSEQNHADLTCHRCWILSQWDGQGNSGEQPGGVALPALQTIAALPDNAEETIND